MINKAWLLLLLAQAPTVPVWTNTAPRDGRAITVEARPAPPKPLPEAELAGLRANQYVAIPPEWLMGATWVSTGQAFGSSLLAPQPIPARPWENAPRTIYTYHPPIFRGPVFRPTTPIVIPRK